MPQKISFAIGLLSLCLVISGCQTQDSSVDLSSARQEFSLSEEPAQAVTVLDLREQEGGFTEGDVVLVGRIGGMPSPWQDDEPNFPWRTGQASFFLVDPSTHADFAGHDHAEGEDHSNCVFCQKRAADSVDSVAAVTFNGTDGQPLAVGVQELFELQEHDTVVVTGAARLLNGEMLVVDAKGIYVRK